MTAQQTNRWLNSKSRNPSARLRLFCFPFAGGGTSIFHKWAQSFPADIDICPVQLPGRENRLMEPPITQLPLLTSILAQSLREYLDIPFAFFGHSMGALICFEFARQLRRLGQPVPVHLFVSSCRSPHLSSAYTRSSTLSEFNFAQMLRNTSRSALWDAEMMKLMRPTLRADFSLCEHYTYVPEEGLNSPITAFGGMQDAEVRRDSLDAWRHQTKSTFRLKMFPGDHFYLEAQRTPLLLAINEDLAKTPAR